MKIEIIPCLTDNYSYLIFEKKTGTVSIVDPSEFGACDEIIKKYKIIGLGAGSLFVFKGKYKAVLINYPSEEEKRDIFSSLTS